jgi:hypothetical protein
MVRAPSSDDPERRSASERGLMSETDSCLVDVTLIDEMSP